MTELEKIAEKVLNCEDLKQEECEYIFLSEDENFDDLLYWSNKIRKHFKGNKVKLCSIINAKSGMCPEDCGFCAQSSHNKAETNIYPLVGFNEVEDAYEKAAKSRSRCFGIVTSGRALRDEEIKLLGETISKIRERHPSFHPTISASLGELSEKQLLYLKNCGLKKYHHNLETTESFFTNVCTTHSFSDRVATLKAVKKVNIELCCGGIFGIGEDWHHRLEFALTLGQIDPDSIPLNFFNPIKGTRLEKTKPLSSREILKIIAMFRFVLPQKDISVCGGREVNLRDLQSWIFCAGANGMMTGDYLTTAGRNPDIDKKMLEDLDLKIDYEK